MRLFRWILLRFFVFRLLIAPTDTADSAHIQCDNIGIIYMLRRTK